MADSKSRNQRTKKPQKSTTLYSAPTFWQKQGKNLIGLIGIALTSGALLGLLTSRRPVLGIQTTSPPNPPTLVSQPAPEESQTRRIKQQITHWQQVIDQNPTYRDGYIQLAYLYYQLQDFDQVQVLLNQIRTIDPNWQHLGEVTQMLQAPQAQ